MAPNSCGFASQRSSDQRGHLWYPEVVATGSTGSWEPKWAAPQGSIFDGALGAWICDDMCAHVVWSYVIWFHSICFQIRTFEEICAPAYVIPTCTNHSVQIKSNLFSKDLQGVTLNPHNQALSHYTFMEMHQINAWMFYEWREQCQGSLLYPQNGAIIGLPETNSVQPILKPILPGFWRLPQPQISLPCKMASRALALLSDGSFIEGSKQKNVLMLGYYLHIARAVGNWMSLSYILSLEFFRDFRVANRSSSVPKVTCAVEPITLIELIALRTCGKTNQKKNAICCTVHLLDQYPSNLLQWIISIAMIAGPKTDSCSGYSYYMLLLYLTLAPRGPNMVEPCWTPGGFPTGSPNLSIREVRCSRWEAVDPRPSWPWQPRSQVGAARAAAALPARMKINMERYHTMRQRRVKLDHMTWAKWKYRENPSRQ